MALILARGRRRDRFGQCLLHFDDLPREEAVALVHLVCAALRRDLTAAVGVGEADRLLGVAGERLLASQIPEARSRPSTPISRASSTRKAT